MGTAQQQARQRTQLRDADVEQAFTNQRPLCAGADVDPNWWDIETHNHNSRFACIPCRKALATCAECPLKLPCAILGSRSANPLLIYSGRSWTSGGRPIRGCRRCRVPIVGSGRRRETGMCSLGCELNETFD